MVPVVEVQQVLQHYAIQSPYPRLNSKALKMGVTEPWMVTTEGQKNWTAACEREISARFNWNSKWGWMPSVMRETNEKLKELKAKQNARIQEKEISAKKTITKDPRPLPNSSNHEYGWLAQKPEYQIERFGPFPLTMKVRVEPTLQEIDEEVARQDAERAQRAIEKKKDAGKALNRDEREAAFLDSKMEKTQGPIDPSAMGSHNEKSDRTGDQIHKAVIPVDRPISQVIKDPGHVQSDARKIKLCCCTAQCICKRLAYKNRNLFV